MISFRANPLPFIVAVSLLMTVSAGNIAVARIQYVNIRFKQLSVSDGLPHNTINTIAQDNDGFLWIGTPNGLCRYDGYSFRYYSNSPSDSSSIFHNFIHHIHNDPQRNRLWILTDRGFGWFDLKTENFHKSQIGGFERRNVTFMNSSSGDLLVGTYGGVFKYNEESDSFEEYIIIKNRVAGKLYEDSSGTLWIKSGSKVLRYDTANNRFMRLPQALESFEGNMNNIFMTQNDRIVFNDFSDFWIYDIRNDHFARLPKEIDTKGYRCINSDSEGNIWIGTEFGIFIYDIYNRLVAHFDCTPNDLSALNDSPVYCIFHDRNHNMWVGTYFGGINYFIYGTDQFKTYPFGLSENHLSGKAVRQIINDGKGGLLITTEDGGLNHINAKGKVTRSDVIHKKLGLKNIKNVHSAHFSDDGDLWVGLFLKGVIRYSPKTGHVIDYSKLTDYNTSGFSIAENNGKIYYAGPEGLYAVPVNGTPSIKRISGDRFYCSIRQNDSTVWIGSRNNGLFELNTATDSLSHMVQLSGRNMFITYLYKDSDSLTWVGTNNSGLYVLDNRKNIVDAFYKDRLGTYAIKGIVEDSYGSIWVGTDDGLCRIDKETSKITKLTDSDGLPIKQFNFASACMAPDGELYFGTINGMISFHPEQINIPEPNFKIKITGLYSLVDGQSLSLGNKIDKGTLTLTHDYAKSLQIEYSGMNFRYNGKTVYAMKMEGLDKDWQIVGNQYQVRFSNLSPGKYTLKIKAGHDGQNWDEAGQLTLPISVKAPWWATIWAFIVYFSVAGVSIYHIARYTKTRLALHMKLKSEREKRVNMEKLNQQKINFFSYVSHDLKTPLTLILSPLQRLIAKRQITNDDKDKLEVIYKNAERMNYLIDELLTFSKIEMDQMSINVRKGDIMKFLKETSQIFRISAEEKGIDFILDLEDSGTDVWFSPSKLSRIVYNLLSNAIKYTSEGGEVKLSARLKESKGNTLAVISVKDNGRGIPKDLVPKIFDNYFQINPADQRNGFGLGLSLTRSLVHIHKGEITVASTEGKGSEFVVTLNVSENAYKDTERSLESITADDINKYKRQIKDTVVMVPDKMNEETPEKAKPMILIVEDNKDLNKYIAEIFNGTFKVLRAYNGIEALEILEDKLPDIIISDIMMPEMDGLEFLRNVKENLSTSHIPVIMLTAKTGDNDYTEGYLNGADAYIPKPFNAQNLELLVQNIRANRQKNIERFRQTEELNINSIVNNPRDEKFMKDLMGLISSNISKEEFSLWDITSAFHISRSLLHNKVKALSGCSITQLIRTVRMREAKKLLLDGMNVSETAYAVGFSDPNYFTKCFRKEFGFPPTDFLKGGATEEES